MNKRGSETYILETVIFIVLNIFFISSLLFFVGKTTSDAGEYEQIYAKQIALLIDNSKPQMTFVVDVSKGIEFSKRAKKDINQIIRLNKEKGEVTVSLEGEKGYSFQYFSDYDFTVRIDKNHAIINVKEKEEKEVKGNEA